MAKKLIRTICLATALLSCADIFASEGWLTDFKEAREKAKKDKLLILADFTGSDWCVWCKKLDNEVFSKKAFKEFAEKNFALLMIDFPSLKKLSQKEKQRNQELAEKFGIKGFPTVLILDADGKVLAQTGYQAGGAENYIKHLEEIIEKYKPSK
jgi:protein disulfide-isomerase